MSAPLYTDIPLESKVKAERTLLGAMLRDCHLMPKVISGLNIVALSQASDGMGVVFLEIIEQFKANGKYTVTTVNRKAKFKDLAYLASEDTDVDLLMALDWWWLEYSKWAQLMAYSAASAAGQTDALTMKEAVALTEIQLGLNWSNQKSSAPEDFEEWGMRKIEGTSIEYPTKSSIRALRELIPCYEPGYVWTISGATSMGKSQFAINEFSAFCNQGARGIFFTLEMKGADVYKRLLGIRHGFNPKGQWHESDYPAIREAITETKSISGKVIDGLFSISEIEAACVAQHYNGGIDYVFIDLLNYVQAPYTKGNSEAANIGAIYKVLVKMAKVLDCVVFMVSHINREVSKRGGSMRPQLSDLKNSGSIEQDSAGVIFLYRPEYYNILEDEHGNPTKDRGEIIVAKSRNDAIGSRAVEWNYIRGYRDIQPAYTPHNPTAEPFKMSRVEPDEKLPF